MDAFAWFYVAPGFVGLRSPHRSAATATRTRARTRYAVLARTAVYARVTARGSPLPPVTILRLCGSSLVLDSAVPGCHWLVTRRLCLHGWLRSLRTHSGCRLPPAVRFCLRFGTPATHRCVPAHCGSLAPVLPQLLHCPAPPRLRGSCHTPACGLFTACRLPCATTLPRYHTRTVAVLVGSGSGFTRLILPYVGSTVYAPHYPRALRTAVTQLVPRALFTVLVRFTAVGSGLPLRYAFLHMPVYYGSALRVAVRLRFCPTRTFIPRLPLPLRGSLFGSLLLPRWLLVTVVTTPCSYPYVLHVLPVTRTVLHVPRLPLPRLPHPPLYRLPHVTAADSGFQFTLPRYIAAMPRTVVYRYGYRAMPRLILPGSVTTFVVLYRLVLTRLHGLLPVTLYVYCVLTHAHAPALHAPPARSHARLRAYAPRLHTPATFAVTTDSVYTAAPHRFTVHCRCYLRTLLHLRRGYATPVAVILPFWFTGSVSAATTRCHVY